MNPILKLSGILAPYFDQVKGFTLFGHMALALFIVAVLWLMANAAAAFGERAIRHLRQIRRAPNRSMTREQFDAMARSYAKRPGDHVIVFPTKAAR